MNFRGRGFIERGFGLNFAKKQIHPGVDNVVMVASMVKEEPSIVT